MFNELINSILKEEDFSKEDKLSALKSLKDHVDPKDIEKISDIKSFEVVSQYVDDRLNCAEVRINGELVEFMWYEDLGFLYYWDESPRAFKQLKDSIRYYYTTREELGYGG